MEDIYKNTEEKMEKAIESLKRDLGSISTGRATPALLDPIKVECYGNIMPLSQVASITIPDSMTISVSVWDKGMVQAVEKAIINSNLGFTPRTDGTLLRINIPKLSEERRKDFCKVAKKYGEDKKIAIRNIRRDALEDGKKNKDSISEDELKDFNDRIQKLTDNYISKVDEMVKKKEDDLMTV